jgi:hypothetical protein
MRKRDRLVVLLRAQFNATRDSWRGQTPVRAPCAPGWGALQGGMSGRHEFPENVRHRGAWPLLRWTQTISASPSVTFSALDTVFQISE